MGYVNMYTLMALYKPSNHGKANTCACILKLIGHYTNHTRFTINIILIIFDGYKFLIIRENGET